MSRTMNPSSESSPQPPAKRPRRSPSPERSDDSRKVAEGSVLPAPFDHAIAQAKAWRRRRMASISYAISRWTPVSSQFVPQTKYGQSSRSCTYDESPQKATASNSKASDTQQFYCESGRGVKDETVIDVSHEEQERDQKGNPSEQIQPSPDGEKEVDLDCYQTAALQAAKRGDSFFLTGSAGVGKSFVLRRIISELRANSKKVAVTASTGCAAVAIQGCTVHSFLSLGLGMDPEGTLRKRALRDRELRKRLDGLDVLVIDEVSMIDSFLFDKIEIMCAYGKAPKQRRRQRRSVLNEPSSAENETEHPKPPLFGGLQVIVCGDFYQLPPVSCSDYRHQFLKEKFFAFESTAWKRRITKTFCLHEVHRQSDKVFIGMLNELRRGVVSTATKNVLDACCVRRSATPVELDGNGAEIHYTKLYPFRRQVDHENLTQLNEIPVQAVRYLAKDMVSSDLGPLNKRIVRTLLDGVSGLKMFTVKMSCRVLCVKNIDPDMGIVNGSAGIVTGFRLSDTCRLEQLEKFKYMTTEDLAEKRDEMMKDGLLPEEQVQFDESKENDIVSKLLMELPRDENNVVIMSGDKPQLIPVVKFDNGTSQSVPEEKWTVYGLDGKVAGTRIQIPLTLGWALSIHKAQGMTLLNVETDVGGSFDYGQVYVALSRATSLQGLRILSFNPFKVRTHHKVRAFHDSVENEQREVKEEAVARVKKEEQNSDEFLVSDSELLTLTNGSEWWNSQIAEPQSKMKS
ncbi:DNA helicase [Gracilaria domingensis]|nr:DNA helicase [Gracilaria domingensis]